MPPPKKYEPPGVSLDSNFIDSVANKVNPQTTPSPVALHEKPIVVIEPRRSWELFDLRELWQYRELLYFLAWRDIKVRYKQAVFGIAWAILQPLFLMVIFTVFYARVTKIETGAVPYPLFAYAGLTLWTFFSSAVSATANSVVGNANLITKVYFPRIIIPASSVLGCLIDFVVASLLLIGLMFYYGVPLTWKLPVLLLFIVLTALFAFAVGTWLSALNVRYRDVRFAVTFLIQVWLFLSSVVLPSSALSPTWKQLLLLNPMSAFVEGWRASLFGEPFDFFAIGVGSIITLVVLVFALFDFRRMEKSFADVI
jgi:lipopolysaccharide transport system permease protein